MAVEALLAMTNADGCAMRAGFWKRLTRIQPPGPFAKGESVAASAVGHRRAEAFVAVEALPAMTRCSMSRERGSDSCQPRLKAGTGGTGRVDKGGKGKGEFS